MVTLSPFQKVFKSLLTKLLLIKMSFNLLPAEGKDFVDREELLKGMLSDLKSSKSNIGYALYGKRKVGKTSLLLELKRRLNEDSGIVTIYFSLWDLIGDRLPDFIRLFSAEILEGFKPYLGLTHKAKNLLKAPLSIIKESIKNLNLNVKLKDDIEVLLTFDESKENLDRLVEEVFNLPEKLSEEAGLKCVLFIDEFPSIMDLRNGERLGQGIVRKIRTIHERQKNVALCISGSIRKTMSIVALSPASAFYRQLVVREVRPMEKDHVRELVLRNTRRSIDENVIEEIYNFSGGIPFYVQFIGRMLEKYEKVDTDVLQDAISDFLKQEGNIIFKEEFGSLGTKEQKILMAMAAGNRSPTQITKYNNDKLGNTGRFLAYLEEKGYIIKQKKGYYLIDDPVFERWLKTKI